MSHRLLLHSFAVCVRVPLIASKLKHLKMNQSRFHKSIWLWLLYMSDSLVDCGQMTQWNRIFHMRIWMNNHFPTMISKWFKYRDTMNCWSYYDHQHDQTTTAHLRSQCNQYVSSTMSFSASKTRPTSVSIHKVISLLTCSYVVEAICASIPHTHTHMCMKYDIQIHQLTNIM